MFVCPHCVTEFKTSKGLERHISCYCIVINIVFCNVCKVELSKKNTNPGAIKRRNRICMTCERLRNRGYYDKECEDQKKQRKHRKLHNAWEQKLRIETFLAYGNKCVCCGESNWQFLTIDHIYKDGEMERADTRVNSGCATYAYLRKNNFPKDRYQLLCWNCHMSIDRVGYCPHQTQLLLFKSRC